MNSYILSIHHIEARARSRSFPYIKIIEKDTVNLIHTVKPDSKKVGVYPIKNGLWGDIGQLDEYKSMIERL